jgi:hypothetical protein
MNDNFIAFQQFKSRDDLMVNVNVLNSIGVDFLIEEDSVLFNPAFVPAWDDKQWVLKVRARDLNFIKATMDDWAAVEVQWVTNEHPFFAFNEHELIEVVQNPTAWPLLESKLAESILKKRGVRVNANLKVDWNIIKQPPKSQIWSLTTWVLAVLFSLAGGMIGAYLGWILNEAN